MNNVFLNAFNILTNLNLIGYFYMPDAMKHNIIFFGHHKCGSRFFRSGIMTPLAHANGMNIVSYKISNPPFHFKKAHDLDLYNIQFEKLNEGNILLNLSNSGTPVVDTVNKFNKIPYLGVHVLRDPRQVLISNYFHHKKGHNLESAGWVWDQLIEDRPILEKLPRESGIIYEMNHITKDILENQIFPWKSKQNILEIRLEEFDLNTNGIMKKIFDFLKLHNKFDIKQEKRGKNPEARAWEKVFSKKIKDKFKELYGRHLIEIGYENNYDW